MLELGILLSCSIESDTSCGQKGDADVLNTNVDSNVCIVIYWMFVRMLYIWMFVFV